MTHRISVQIFRVLLVETAWSFADECLLGDHRESARNTCLSEIEFGIFFFDVWLQNIKCFKEKLGYWGYQQFRRPINACFLLCFCFWDWHRFLKIGQRNLYQPKFEERVCYILNLLSILDFADVGSLFCKASSKSESPSCPLREERVQAAVFIARCHAGRGRITLLM